MASFVPGLQLTQGACLVEHLPIAERLLLHPLPACGDWEGVRHTCTRLRVQLLH